MYKVEWRAECDDVNLSCARREKTKQQQKKKSVMWLPRKVTHKLKRRKWLKNRTRTKTPSGCREKKLSVELN